MSFPFSTLYMYTRHPLQFFLFSQTLFSFSQSLQMLVKISEGLFHQSDQTIGALFVTSTPVPKFPSTEQLELRQYLRLSTATMPSSWESGSQFHISTQPLGVRSHGSVFQKPPCRIVTTILSDIQAFSAVVLRESSYISSLTSSFKTGIASMSKQSQMVGHLFSLLEDTIVTDSYIDQCQVCRWHYRVVGYFADPQNRLYHSA